MQDGLLSIPKLYGTNPQVIYMNIIVSGLPRSGTSLMMQILSAAGVPCVLGASRLPDIDNPNGYWEPKDAHKLVEHPFPFDGKAVKILSPWVRQLTPAKHGNYVILWMQRSLREVAASQRDLMFHRKLVEEQSRVIPLAENMEAACASARLAFFEELPLNVNVLSVNHHNLMNDQCAEINAIVNFLNEHGYKSFAGLRNVWEMELVISRNLYRQREEWLPK